MSSSLQIPVVDFGVYSVDKDSVCTEKLQELVDETFQAFSAIGVVYLKNHGVDMKRIDRVFKTAQKFFSLSNDEKKKYGVANSKNYHGYNSYGFDGTDNSETDLDLKESFTYRANYSEKAMPDEKVPDFKNALEDLYESCTKLGGRLTEILAKGLNLPDQTIFKRVHANLNGGENTSSIMCHNYLPIPSGYDAPVGQLRCEEHIDTDTLTLLFQDDAGGLEILAQDGKYVAVEPIDGTILVNLGYFMERWASGKLKATQHRVVIPESDIGKDRGRQSVIFFMNPDEDVTVECIDGSSDYPPVKVSDTLRDMFKLIYSC